MLLSNSIRAGVTGLVRTVANEYAAYGITVNNVCPGYTATDRIGELAKMMAERRGIRWRGNNCRMGKTDSRR